MTGPQPTEDKLLMDLIKTNRRTDGETMTKKQYEKHGDYNPWQATNRFDSWKNAKTSAGIYKQDAEKNKISKQKLLNDIQQTIDSQDTELTAQDYRKKGSYSLTTIYNRFDSFQQAKDKA